MAGKSFSYYLKPASENYNITNEGNVVTGSENKAKAIYGRANQPESNPAK